MRYDVVDAGGSLCSVILEQAGSVVICFLLETLVSDLCITMFRSYTPITFRLTLKDQVERDGYVILEDFLSPSECLDMLEAGLELTKNLPSKEERVRFTTVSPDQQQLHEEYFVNSNDKISYFFEDGAVGEDGELKVDPSIALNKVGHALHYLHPVFRCYTYCYRVQNLCRRLDLMEPAVAQSMYIYKNPGIGGEVIPHQDITFLYTSPKPPYGFWIAVEDATVENGCLWVLPGSHKSGVHRRLIRNPDKNSKELLVYDRPAPVYPESKFIPLPVRKGTCIILHGNVVHKSAPNKSDKGRSAYTFHVIETRKNPYSEKNWLQEGKNAPFVNLYKTRQLIYDESELNDESVHQDD